jgi:DNA-binding transcriptional regulator YdaS (Cro superfamily)
MHVANFLRRAKMSQAALAKQLRVSPSLVSAWVLDRCRPRPQEAMALERVTGGAVRATEAIGLKPARRSTKPIR